MKKICTFLCVTLILFFVFACTMPSELEIKGSPSLRFAANMDFGDYFSDMIDEIVNADNGTETLLYTSKEYLVFITRMEIFRKENYECEVDLGTFNLDGTGNITINDIDIPVILEEDDEHKLFVVLENEEVIAESDEPYSVTFMGIEDYLESFEFTGVQAKIYISGSQLANAVRIDLHRVKDDGTEEPIVPDGEIEKGPSGIDEEYIAPDLPPYLPPGGADIEIADIINSGGDLALKYKIYLPEDTVIEYDWLSIPHTIVAEIVIWLPMTFDSIENNAIIKFPASFDGVSDALKSLSGIDCIESMSMKITIDPLNPFGVGNGIFVIYDDGYGEPIECPLDKYNFYFNFTKEELDYINENPFEPRFFIIYPDKNSLLEIPNGDIMITTVSLDAKLKYNMEL